MGEKRFKWGFYHPSVVLNPPTVSETVTSIKLPQLRNDEAELAVAALIYAPAWFSITPKAKAGALIAFHVLNLL